MTTLIYSLILVSVFLLTEKLWFTRKSKRLGWLFVEIVFRPAWSETFLLYFWTLMKSTLYVFVLLLALASYSQNFLSWQYNDRYYSFSIGTGTSTYFGELNDPNIINADLSQISVGLEARLLNRVGARIDGTYFILMGNDENAADSSFQKQRNLSFRSRNLHFQFHLIYYLKPYQGDYY